MRTFFWLRLCLLVILGGAFLEGSLADGLICPKLTALVEKGDGSRVCVDQFECMLVLTDSQKVWPFNQAVDALPLGSYYAVPAAGTLPQAYISADQGSAACQAAGKWLCSLEDWMLACQGPNNLTYPYGDRFIEGACNEGRSSNPVVDIYGPEATFNSTEMNNPQLDLLPDTVATGGNYSQCCSAAAIYDLNGNLDEWVLDHTSSGHGVFKGGYFVDASINGNGCYYTTTAHAPSYHDYSLGFRCCSDPLQAGPGGYF